LRQLDAGDVDFIAVIEEVDEFKYLAVSGGSLCCRKFRIRGDDAFANDDGRGLDRF